MGCPVDFQDWRSGRHASMVATSIPLCWLTGLTQSAMGQWSQSVVYQFAGLDSAGFEFFFLMDNSKFVEPGFSKPQGGAPYSTMMCIIPSHSQVPNHQHIWTAQWVSKIGEMEGMDPWWQLQFPFVGLQASHSQPWSSGLNLFSISLQDWTLQDLKFSSWWVNQNL